MTVVTVHNLVNSSYGRAFISIRDDEIAAEAMGVDTTRFKVLSFVISSMFAGIAGSLFGHFTMYLHPNSSLFTTSFYLIIMIVVGRPGKHRRRDSRRDSDYRDPGSLPRVRRVSAGEFLDPAGADHALPPAGTAGHLEHVPKKREAAAAK